MSGTANCDQIKCAAKRTGFVRNHRRCWEGASATEVLTRDDIPCVFENERCVDQVTGLEKIGASSVVTAPDWLSSVTAVDAAL